ncbi:hypothetical protein NL676_020689 [Syzygium grande]|nr:hypothetical protein NL676_020689 [Syzygium grande]
MRPLETVPRRCAPLCPAAAAHQNGDADRGCPSPPDKRGKGRPLRPRSGPWRGGGGIPLRCIRSSATIASSAIGVLTIRPYRASANLPTSSCCGRRHPPTPPSSPSETPASSYSPQAMNTKTTTRPGPDPRPDFRPGFMHFGSGQVGESIAPRDSGRRRVS